MLILPAIDLCGGQCVRLVRGDFGTASRVAESPLLAARRFEQAGARWLHMVDLDGARTGARPNRELILQTVLATSLHVELGGGIRTMQAVDDALTHGVARVILGSAALRDPALVQSAVRKWGERIAVGVDARNGKVAASGWLDDSEVSYLDFARRMERAGVRTLIFTDISRDGTLSGLPLDELRALRSACGCRLIASGGVAGLDDVRAVAALGLYGVICGKAVYSGRLDLKQAIAEGGRQDVGETDYPVPGRR